MLDEKQDEVQGDDEKDIEALFDDFINAIKALPQEDLDKLHDNMKKLEDNE